MFCALVSVSQSLASQAGLVAGRCRPCAPTRDHRKSSGIPADSAATRVTPSLSRTGSCRPPRGGPTRPAGRMRCAGCSPVRRGQRCGWVAARDVRKGAGLQVAVQRRSAWVGIAERKRNLRLQLVTVDREDLWNKPA